MMVKRCLSVFFALVMLVCSVTAFAADTTNVSSSTSVENSDNRIVPTASQWNICYDVGTTSTTEKKGRFVVGSAYATATLHATVYASAPCDAYIFFYDTSGKMLGASSIHFTKKTSVTVDLLPRSLSSGTYYYGYYFSKSGVSYIMDIYAML